MATPPRVDPLPDDAPQSEPVVLDRRGLLGALAGMGAVALGGGLGQSLLVRPAHAQKLGQVRTTTASDGWSGTNSFTSTIAPTITLDGTMTNTREPGTWTETAVAHTLVTYTMTTPYPAPFGGTQPVTVAGSDSYSFTPPATSTQTYSWNGTSYSCTSSRTPTYVSCTMTESLTCTYSTTTPGGNMADEVEVPEGVRLERSEDPHVVEGVEAEGLDLFDVRSRRSAPTRVRFVHGIAI